MGVEIYRGNHFLEFKDPFNLPGIQFVKGIFTNAIKPVKRYSITGYIRFDYQFRWNQVDVPPPGDAKVLRQAILDADKVAPWKGDTHQSIRYLGPGAWVNCQSNETCIFQIAPPYEVMTQAQMYAYEKYLAVLADTLAKQKIEGVESVLYGIEASTSQRFMVPGISPE
jgi:hypothetical protein